MAQDDEIGGFITDRGSEYAHFGDATTIRNRSGANHLDKTTGFQPRSGKTIFMNKEATNSLGGYFQNPDMATKLEPEIVDGKPTGRASVVLTEDYGPKKAGSKLSTFEYTTKPSVGRYPVEIYKSTSGIGDVGKGIHFGTEIKKVLKKVPWVGAALTAATSANAGDLVEAFFPIPFGELGNSDIDIPASEFLRRLESGEKIPQQTIDRLMAKKIQGNTKIID
jgi:hypothetical protein